MLKLEKIITLFSLFYKIKKFSTFNKVFSNFKKVKFYSIFCYNMFLPCLVKQSTWKKYFFLLASTLKNTILINKLYLCFKLHLRIVIVSIYFKKILLLSVFKSLKKKIRTKKRLERLYKRKGLIYGVRKIRRWNKWIREEKIKKKIHIRKIRKSLFRFIFKSLLKFIDVFKVNNISIYFFKSNRYIKKRGLKRTYQKERHKIYKQKIIRKLKRLFFLKFFKNIKFKIKLSNNFSHSRKFLKLRKKRA